MKPLLSSRRASSAAVVITLALIGLQAPTYADPLNPLDFPSLGTPTLTPGVYALDSGATPPTFSGGGLASPLVGTVSTDASSPGIAVFRFDALSVPPGAVINITGNRPVAILSSTDLTFAGTLNANGGNGVSGTTGAAGIGGQPAAGGGAGGLGGISPTGGPLVFFSGNPGLGFGGGGIGSSLSGGGGSFGGLGGSFTNGNVAFGGPTYGNLLRRLEAGSGGGGGGGIGSTGRGGGGGAGGGAVELGALGSLTIAGQINANGGDRGAGFAGGSSGGGGSGGGVLLHGQLVTLSGNISANGGGEFTNGGGGGGGRVAIQSTNGPGTSQVTVSGGHGNNSVTGNETANPGVITNAHPALIAADLDFGLVTVGTSKTLFMGVGNGADPDTAINGLFPAAAAPFAPEGTAIFSGLKPGRFAASPYTFAPTVAGQFNQTLTILSDAGNVSITIRGTAVANLADFNADGFVDLDDFAIFQLCFAGPRVLAKPCP